MTEFLIHVRKHIDEVKVGMCPLLNVSIQKLH